MVTRLKCPEIQRPGRQGSGMKDPRATGALVLEWRQNRERGARACRALTGLTGFINGITWACARRTRSSPGYHMGGLQPQSGIPPRSPSSSELRLYSYRLQLEEIPEMPEWGLESVVQDARSEWVMMLKKMITARVREEIGGQGSERSPSPRPVLSILRSRATAEDGRSPACGTEGGRSPGSQDAKNPESDHDHEQDQDQDQETQSPGGVQGLKARNSNLGEFSSARERERLRPRGGNAGAPGWRGLVWGDDSGLRLNGKVRNHVDGIAFVFAAHSGEDTLVGHGGILDLDLDLDQSGPFRTLSAWDDEAARQRPESRGQRSEEGCSFVLQDADGEWVMTKECPEFSSRVGGEDGIVARMGDEGGDVSFVPNGTGALTFRSTHRWKRWACIGRPYGTSAAGGIPGRTRVGKESKSRRSFVPEDIGGEMLMSRNCPEISHPKTGFSIGDVLRQRPAADLGLSAKRSGWCFTLVTRGVAGHHPWLLECSRGYAHTGLRNGWGGIPRAPLADSPACAGPGLTSGCTFGAKKRAVPSKYRGGEFVGFSVRDARGTGRRCGSGRRAEDKGQEKGAVSFWKILEMKW